MSADLQPGHWAVVHGSRSYAAESYEITESTEKTVTVLRCGRPVRMPKTQVYATFETKQAAWQLVTRIRSIRGELDRRILAADQWAARSVAEAIKKETEK